MYHNFFIHSSVNRHLGCFHTLAIVNSAVMNSGVHVSFQLWFFSEYMPNNGIPGSYGSFSPNFLRNLYTVLPEKTMAPHSSTLAWKIPWMEEPGRLQSMGRQESDTTERLHFDFSLSCIEEGNSNPLQCSCLENPRDGEPGGLPSMGSHRVRHD